MSFTDLIGNEAEVTEGDGYTRYQFDNETRVTTVNGAIHSINDMPAIYAQGVFMWLKGGLLHRLTGPALSSGTVNEFYINGVHVDKLPDDAAEQYEKELANTEILRDMQRESRRRESAELEAEEERLNAEEEAESDKHGVSTSDYIYDAPDADDNEAKISLKDHIKSFFK